MSTQHTFVLMHGRSLSRACTQAAVEQLPFFLDMAAGAMVRFYEITEVLCSEAHPHEMRLLRRSPSSPSLIPATQADGFQMQPEQGPCSHGTGRAFSRNQPWAPTVSYIGARCVLTVYTNGALCLRHRSSLSGPHLMRKPKTAEASGQRQFRLQCAPKNELLGGERRVF
jgi:hypothetical protein